MQLFTLSKRVTSLRSTVELLANTLSIAFRSSRLVVGSGLKLEAVISPVPDASANERV